MSRSHHFPWAKVAQLYEEADKEAERKDRGLHSMDPQRQREIAEAASKEWFANNTVKVPPPVPHESCCGHKKEIPAFDRREFNNYSENNIKYIRLGWNALRDTLLTPQEQEAFLESLSGSLQG